MHRLVYIYASYLLIESFIPARWWESSKSYKVSLLVTANWEKTTFLQWNRERTSGNRRTGRIPWRKLGRVMVSRTGRGGRGEWESRCQSWKVRKHYNRDIKIVYIRQKGSDRYDNRKGREDEIKGRWYSWRIDTKIRVEKRRETVIKCKEKMNELVSVWVRWVR